MLSQLKHAGASWSMLEPAGACWSRLEHAGARWSVLKPAGACWNQLEAAGSRWSPLEPAGSPWSPLTNLLVLVVPGQDARHLELAVRQRHHPLARDVDVHDVAVEAGRAVTHRRHRHVVVAVRGEQRRRLSVHPAATLVGHALRLRERWRDGRCTARAEHSTTHQELHYFSSFRHTGEN